MSRRVHGDESVITAKACLAQHFFKATFQLLNAHPAVHVAITTAAASCLTATSELV